MNRIFRSLDVLLGIGLTAALAMCLLTALPTSASAADAATEQRAVVGFVGLDVAGSFDVRVRQASRDSVELRAEADLLPLIETVIEGDKVLHVRWKRFSSVRTSSHPIVDIGVVQLQSLLSSGSSKVKVEGMKSPRLSIQVSGAGDVSLNDLSNEQLTLGISGSGDVKATGQAERLQIKISGSGDVRTEGLKADEVSVSIAGSGDAAVRAEKTLKVAIAGSGDVSYTGAATVKSSIAGSGRVHKR